MICWIILIIHIAHVSSRPSSPSSSSLLSKHRQQLSDKEFCTLESFQNCLNVDLFRSSKTVQNTNNNNNKNQQSHDSESDDKNIPTESTSNNSSKEYETNNSKQIPMSQTSSSTSSSTDLSFPTTIEELSVTCHDLKENVKCLDDHSERCFDQQMMQIFGHIVTNAKQFVYDLCDNRQIQTGSH